MRPATHAPLQGSLFGTGEPAVDHAATFERLVLDPDGEHASWVDVCRGWLAGADTLFAQLVSATDWRQGRRTMWGREVDDPRLSRWYPPRAPAAALPHPALHVMRRELRCRYARAFGGPGLNYYRDGQDSVAPHADRELRVLDDTLIAIVTLGGTRPFLIRPKGGGRSIDVRPGSGDLLVMGGRCQLAFEHAVPKVAHADPRISVSYRWHA